MASASVLHQEPSTTTDAVGKEFSDPEQSFSGDSTFHSDSSNPSNIQDVTTQVTATTHSLSEHEQVSKASTPSHDVMTPSSLSSVEIVAAASSKSHHDAEFVQDATQLQSLPSSSSSSRRSSRSNKRKMEEEDMEYYVKNNPELYGLRRSARERATPAPPVIESASDDDSASDIDPRPARKRARKIASTRTQRSSKTQTPKVQSRYESSHSEEDSYGGVRARALTKKNRRLKLSGATVSSTPSGNEVPRFSTRGLAPISYNEQDSEDEFLEDSVQATQENWAETNDDSPAIDKVLLHRPIGEILVEDPKKEDYEYKVKWQDQSYYHATWEKSSDLADLKGAKRVKNYYEKVALPQHWLDTDPYVQLEAKEQAHMEREETQRTYLEHTKIERVIDRRSLSNGDSEYLVLWRGLTYEDCTWESGELVRELAQPQIDSYLDRMMAAPVSDRKETNIQTRSDYRRFPDQPSYIKNGELRNFQIHGVNFLAHNWTQNRSSVLADEMGLGKTVQSVAFMSWLRHARQQNGPFLVVVPLSTMRAWADTFDHWAPDMNYVIYLGKEQARAVIKEKELFFKGDQKKPQFHVLLTTSDYIIKPDAWTHEFKSLLKWQLLVVDEAHRLKNRASKVYQDLMDLKVPHRLLITGTPVQNNLTELAALMDFLMPGEIEIDEDIDLESSEIASQKIAEMHSKIKSYFIRRTKDKVEQDLPPKTEKVIRVELSDVQTELYKNVLEKNYTALNQGGNGHKQSLLNLMGELKKVSNHPFLFPAAEARLLNGITRNDETFKKLVTSSGKMMLIDRLFTLLRKNNHRVLVFSQMVKMLDVLAQYLQLRGYKFQRIDGTVPGATRQRAMDHFNAPDSEDFCFLLSTRAGGLGINLMTADTVILFDSDWNPQADLQAMSRAHRIGQKKPVTIYRFVSKNTIEEEILERARTKLMLEFITIQRGVTDNDTTEFSKKLSDAKKMTDSPADANEISAILKNRSRKMFEETGNQKKLEDLDIEAVIENAEQVDTQQQGLAPDGGEEFLKQFQFTDVKVDLEWDQIIPEERLTAIKEQERVLEEQRAFAELVEQHGPRKRNAPRRDNGVQEVAKKRIRDVPVVDSDDDQDDQDDDSDATAHLDPKRPLEQKELRRIIRAYEQFGYVEDHPDKLANEAKLVVRDPDFLSNTLNDLFQMCKDKVEAAATGKDAENQAAKKAEVTFEFLGVKRLNANTLLHRGNDLRMLRDSANTVNDFKSFRVPDATKPSDYTVTWGALEDGMLCIGVVRHGYGNWTAIRDDPELSMQDKLFLDEKTTERKEQLSKDSTLKARKPGPTHLVRRFAYLIDALKASTSNGSNPKAQKAMENHHRNTKKSGTAAGRLPDSSRPSQNSSPAPVNMSKSNRDSTNGGAKRFKSNDRRPSSHLKPSDRPHSDRPSADWQDLYRPKHRLQDTDDRDSRENKRPRLSVERDAADHRDIARQKHNVDRIDRERDVTDNRDVARQKRDADHMDRSNESESKRRRLSPDNVESNRHESDRYTPQDREVNNYQRHLKDSHQDQSGKSKRPAPSEDHYDANQRHTKHRRTDSYDKERSRYDHHRRDDRPSSGHRRTDSYGEHASKSGHHRSDRDTHERSQSKHRRDDNQASDHHKSGQREVNGSRNEGHRTSDRHRDGTRNNGSRTSESHRHRDRTSEHKRSSHRSHEDRKHDSGQPSGPLAKDEKMEAFFQPVSDELERLKCAKELKGAEEASGTDGDTFINILREVLRSVGKHIGDLSQDGDEGTEDKAWLYLANHLWISKIRVGKLKKAYEGLDKPPAVSTAEPVADSTAEPVPNTIAEPEAKPTAEPVVHSTAELKADAAAVVEAYPIASPVADSTGEPASSS